MDFAQLSSAHDFRRWSVSSTVRVATIGLLCAVVCGPTHTTLPPADSPVVAAASLDKALGPLLLEATE